jgi:serine/threonine protein kinase
MFTRLGNYRLLDQIGEGGMGTVYKAERDDGSFEQRVAIKLLRPGITDVDRFDAERRVLAQLRHPYIASLVDGGSVDGIPYIVMELVDGVPIDQYIRNHALNQRERLELFILVCQAVQHAHASLIVHRDLKPANILVTSEGIPKLLDFGIARRDGSKSTMLAPLTPRYASPEHYTGGIITTASDVYSLGVLLKELLEDTPLDLDLTNVLAMATRQEPERRYGSVAQFGEDLRRYLDGMMVIARPDTLFYRWSKFSRRNKLPISLGIILTISVIASGFFFYREGRRAQRRFDEVHSLLNSVLTEIDSEASNLVGSAKVRGMMVAKALNYLNRLAEESGGDRKLLAELAYAYHKVGDIQGHRRFQNLGKYNESLESHLKGIRIEERLIKDDPDNPHLRNQLAWGYAHAAELYSLRGDSEKAMSYAALAQPLANPKDPALFVDALIAISRVFHFDGQLERALKMLESALPVSLEVGGPMRRVTVLKWANEEASYLGLTPLALRYADEAIALTNQVKLQGNDLLRNVIARRDRAVALSQAANPSEERHCDAVPDMQFAAEQQTIVHNQDPKSINRLIQAVTAWQMLSASQALCGQQEAIASARRAIEIYNADKKRVNPDLDWHLAFAHFTLKQYREAEQVLAAVTTPEPAIFELQARLALLGGDKARALRLLATARSRREVEINPKNFERFLAGYRQANNIVLALKNGDTTPGLKQQAQKYLDAFAPTGVAPSITRLREELARL